MPGQTGDIPVTYAFRYSNELYTIAQQVEGRLMRIADQNPDWVGQGFQEASFDRIHPSGVRQKTGRRQDTQYSYGRYSRRKVTLLTSYDADLIDYDDMQYSIHTNSLPMKRLNNSVYALRRDEDDIYIRAALGDAVQINEDKSVSTIPLPDSQKVPVGGTGFTLDKWRHAKYLLDRTDVDKRRARYLVISSEELHGLLGQEQYTSADYAAVKALVEGEATHFLGMEVITIERLPYTGNVRHAFACVGDAVGFAVGRRISGRIDQLPHKQMGYQTWASHNLGAVRKEDELVAQIDCQISLAS